MISVSEPMGASAAASPTVKKHVVLAIAVGAFLGGTVNLLWVCVQEGWDIPLYIAAGLIGREATHGGAGTWFLGLVLHFFIACTWATVYYLASRKLPFLTEYPLIGGLNFGVWVQLFMLLVVLPHSGLHGTEPVTLYGLAVKMVVFGLPVAYSVRHFAPAQAPRQVVPS
ncbi:MAG: hypothetical protein ABSD75_13310 [Terriglobales bacterium]|jgi:hypothetical protein